MGRLVTVYKGLVKGEIVHIGITTQKPTDRFRTHEKRHMIESFQVIAEFTSVEDALKLEKDLTNPSEEEKRLAITEDVMVILEMTEPSEELQLLAIQCANIIIGLLPNPSERVQLEAVNRNGYNLKYLQNPSEQIQVTALQSDGTAIEFIPNPTAEMQLIAVKQSPYALEKIEVPTEEAQWYVIKHHLDVVARLRNFTPKMQERIEKRRKAFDRLLVMKEKAVDSYFQ